MSFLTKFSKIFRRQPAERIKQPLVYKPIKKIPPKPKLVKGPVSVKKVNKILNKARDEAREIIFEARDKALKIKNQATEEARKVQIEISRKIDSLQSKEELLKKQQLELERKLVEVSQIKKQQLAKLERVAGLTTKEAKKLILAATKKTLSGEIARQIKEAEEKIKKEADEKAKDILTDSMYRGATDFVSEYTVSSVKLTDEDMKGRVIGREGRNIRSFEKATGVDVDLDEEGVIRLSSFDSVRREIARVALEKLMADGRIQPARIEETVSRTKKNIENIIFRAGEDLCHRVKVYNLPSDIVKMLGRFKYRFSYGQNMITHTLEVTKIGVHLAYEVGANVNVVRLGCLLHDIGKVITEEEGSHVKTGTDFLKKYNIPVPVINCVAQHHEDEPFSAVESILVYIADAISGSRPGARYADYEGYLTRLTKLEELAKSFKGVKDAYALQAGREIRVIVNPQDVNESRCVELANDLRNKIKKNLTYPGQIKINIIRETRATAIA